MKAIDCINETLDMMSKIMIILCRISLPLFSHLLISEVEPGCFLILCSMCDRAFDIPALYTFRTITSHVQDNVIIRWVSCHTTIRYFWFGWLQCCYHLLIVIQGFYVVSNKTNKITLSGFTLDHMYIWCCIIHRDTGSCSV